jgi:hypothetical protein
MKRNLAILVGLVAALGTTAANADNNFAFDDPYWKRAETVHAFPTVKSESSVPAGTQSRGAYDLVDNYNP